MRRPLPKPNSSTPLAFAAQKHRDQRPRRARQPYINHPIELARV